MDYAITKRSPCSVCGAGMPQRERWFLVSENRWLDRLRIYAWHPALASRQGFKSACSRQHLKVLIAYWLDEANLRLLPRTSDLLPITSDPRREDPEPGTGISARLVGELSVFREAFSRVWTGSSATLDAIVDALIPDGDSAQPMAAGLQFFQPAHDPPDGLSLHQGAGRPS
jgi:hypothetical protein